jgi:protein-S-isoprenylcysteine O-methyltransferase Ste14
VHNRSAAAGSLLFFVLAPGVVAGFIPWLLTAGYGEDFSPHLEILFLAAVLIVAGVAVLVHAFGRFVAEGRGTPAPIAPTEKLVVGGIYRYVRNPMYVAVVCVILGQALLFGSLMVLIWAIIAGTAMATFVRIYEEPVLSERYGTQYDVYRNAVPGWLPRITPWRGK